jgi:hypothetical protein
VSERIVWAAARLARERLAARAAHYDREASRSALGLTEGMFRISGATPER